MRLRTFLATYVLFLVIFFGGLGIVSAYMTGSQLDMLKEKSVAEYQTIAASFAKDIAVLSGRQQEPEEFVKSVHALAEAYAGYYRKNGITLRLEEVPPPETEAAPQSELSYARQGQEHFLFISENLSVPLQQYFRLEYAYNITGNIADLDAIRRVLLALALGCSVLTAFALYAILTKVFSPFSVVARVSRKIAGGMYSERIHVKGSHELASMARDFNRMAAKIERQIHLLEEETAQKQQFVDNFAHEIRTPLTSIYGYAEYVQNAPLDKAEVIESAQAILKEAGYMRKIADSLLELATLRQYAANKRAIDLPRLLADVCQSLRSLASTSPERNVEILCKSGSEILHGQEDLLRSLLMNLGFNAWKACPPQGGIIWIASRKEGGRVVLSVTDNGCGIPAESVDKVTEPFFRVDRARSRETGGAGLGLALCRQIADAHGADMRIASQPGLGTKIEIFFTTP